MARSGTGMARPPLTIDTRLAGVFATAYASIPARQTVAIQDGCRAPEWPFGLGSNGAFGPGTAHDKIGRLTVWVIVVLSAIVIGYLVVYQAHR